MILLLLTGAPPTTSTPTPKPLSERVRIGSTAAVGAGLAAGVVGLGLSVAAGATDSRTSMVLTVLLVPSIVGAGHLARWSVRWRQVRPRRSCEALRLVRSSGRCSAPS